MSSKTKDIGRLSEISVMKAFMRTDTARCSILTPYGENESYDFVVDVSGNFFRVQVKTGSLDTSGTKIVAKLCKSRHNGKEYYKSF
jgi:hypothetical protein